MQYFARKEWLGAFALSFFLLLITPDFLPAQTEYEIVLKNGNSMITSGYREINDTIYIRKYGGTIGISKGDIKEIKVRDEYCDAEVIEYSGKKEDTGTDVSSQYGRQKPSKATLTNLERRKLYGELTQCEQKLRVLRAEGPRVISGHEKMVAARKAVQFGGPLLNDQELYQQRLRMQESKCQRIRSRIDGRIVQEPRSLD